MVAKWIDFPNIPQLSFKDVSYTTEIPALRPFYNYTPSLEAFASIIEQRKKRPVNRKALVEVLIEQYKGLSSSNKVEAQIEALRKEHTFTLITAHQPSLFTGPLYYIYKILSTIHLSRKLNAAYPTYHFVPVFVTGGEDHDFEEVNYINLFKRKLVWENDQNGAVGMMSTKSLLPVLEKLKEILGTSEKAAQIYKLIHTAYTQHETYGMATIHLAHELFKEYGLVIANMNHPKLKRLFIPEIKEEIFNRPSKNLVSQTAEQLSAIDFKPQAYPREINFFYLKENLRKRIVYEDGVYQVLNTSYSFSREEMEQEIEQYPAHFSPNVVMRPLYQEKIMPNLAYIGGGGEIAYWLERKTQFAHFGIHFPMLIRRNSVLWLDKGTCKKLRKFNLSVDDIFNDTDSIIRNFVESASTASLEIQSEIAQVSSVFDTIAIKGKKIDATLEKAILAEKTKQLKALQQLEGRLIRAEKQKHEVALNQIRNLKEKLFPKNGLQERYDNFLEFYLKYGHSFFDVLLERLNPLEKKFLVISDCD